MRIACTVSHTQQSSIISLSNVSDQYGVTINIGISPEHKSHSCMQADSTFGTETYLYYIIIPTVRSNRTWHEWRRGTSWRLGTSWWRRASWTCGQISGGGQGAGVGQVGHTGHELPAAYSSVVIKAVKLHADASEYHI